MRPNADAPASDAPPVEVRMGGELHGGLSNSTRWLIAACIVASGACGLVYEVVWSRLLSSFLGATAHAHVLVLAAYMAGMALGNAALGRTIDRRASSALRIYAGLEIFIGIFGFLSPSILTVVRDVYSNTAQAFAPEQSLLWLKFLVSSAFILVPTFCMGGTIPAIYRLARSNHGDAHSSLGKIYFLNTAGAAIGAAIAGLALISMLGLTGAARAAGLVNLVIGLTALGIDRQLRVLAAISGENHDPNAAAQSTDQAAPARNRLLLVALVAFVSGFASFSLEIAWTRIFGTVLGSSNQSFASMLTTFLAGIAFGGAASAAIQKRLKWETPLLLAALCAAATMILALQLPFYERLPWWQFRWAWLLERRADVFPVYLSGQALAAFLWMLPVTFASGALLPLVADWSRHVLAGDAERVGRVFSVNTLGAVIAPFATNFLLLPQLGIQRTIVVSAAAYALISIACLQFVATLGAREKRALSAVLVAVVAAAFILPQWNNSVMHAGGFRRWTIAPEATFSEFRALKTESQILYEKDGPVDSVVVVENIDGLRFMKVNGKTDASDEIDLPTMRQIAHIPLTLHAASSAPGPRDVFVVGIGSGASVASAARHPQTSVTVVEISDAVFEASRFFSHVNASYESLPNVKVHLGDAREWLMRDDTRWDVIINQPSNPWVAGNSALFSQEFFELTKSRLKPGGVLAQWVHLYAMNDASIEIIMQTFASVYPHVTAWSVDQADFLLLGSDTPLAFDLDRGTAALEAAAVAAEGETDNRGEGTILRNFDRLLALQIFSEIGFREEFGRTKTLTTDLNPVLEEIAPVAQFIGTRSSRITEADERLQPRRGLLEIERRLGNLDRADLFRFYADRKSPAEQRLAASLALTSPQLSSEQYEIFIDQPRLGAVWFEAWSASLRAQCANGVAPSPETLEIFREVSDAVWAARRTIFVEGDKPPVPCAP